MDHNYMDLILTPNVGDGEGVIIIIQGRKLSQRKMVMAFPQGEMVFERWNSSQNFGFLRLRSSAISTIICS